MIGSSPSRRSPRAAPRSCENGPPAARTTASCSPQRQARASAGLRPAQLIIVVTDTSHGSSATPRHSSRSAASRASFSRAGTHTGAIAAPNGTRGRASTTVKRPCHSHASRPAWRSASVDAGEPSCPTSSRRGTPHPLADASATARGAEAPVPRPGPGPAGGRTHGGLPDRRSAPPSIQTICRFRPHEKPLRQLGSRGPMRTARNVAVTPAPAMLVRWGSMRA
jgi:hypothetical protein